MYAARVLTASEVNALSGLLRKRPRSSKYDAKPLPLTVFEAASSPAARKRMVAEGLVSLRRGPPNGFWLVDITTKGKRLYHRARRAHQHPSGGLPPS